MAFFTIFTADGLSAADYRRALASSGPFVSTRRRDHHEMLRTAGFREVRETDLTAAFIETSRAWRSQRQKYAKELISDEGEAAFRERQEDNEIQTRAAEAGLLRRAMFVCS